MEEELYEVSEPEMPERDQLYDFVTELLEELLIIQDGQDLSI